jgi:hypothetical protein
MNYGPHTTGSDTIGELAAALSSLQTAMKPAAENSVNPHFKSKYADLASCWDAVRPHLKGLSITQSVASSGKTVEITTLLIHSSGQWLSSTLGLEARDPSPQATGSAITYGRRYGFCSALGISSGDDDGEAAQPSRPAPTPRPTAPAGQPIPLPADRRAKALEAFNEQIQSATKAAKNPRDLLGMEFKASSKTADELFAAALQLKEWNV